jgi:hypothetical protein
MSSLLRVSALLLTLVVSLSLGAIEPFAGPEVALGPLTRGRAEFLRQNAMVAGSEHGFFVVWIDGRSGRMLIGTRLSPEGEVLDGNGIVLSERYAGEYAAVAWDGRDWVVSGLEGLGLTRWRIAPDGRVPAREPVPDADPVTRNARGETIALRGHGQDMIVSFFDAAGTRQRELVVPDLTFRGVDLLVPDGEDWLVLMRTQKATFHWLRLHRVDGVKGSNGVYSYSGQFVTYDFATNGREIALVWFSVATGELWSPRDCTSGYTIVSENGTVSTIRDKTEQVEFPGYEAPPMYPAVMWDGSEFWFSWSTFDNQENHELRLLRRGQPEAQVIDRAQRSYNYGGYAPRLAGGSRNAIVWRQHRITASSLSIDVVAQTFDKAAAVDVSEEPALLSRSGTPQLNPRAATGPSGMFTAWRESSSTGTIVGRFLPAAGAGTAPIRLSNPSRDADRHDVAASGDTFLVGWREIEWTVDEYSRPLPLRLSIFARRFDHLGNAIDPEPVLLQKGNAPQFIDENGVHMVAEGDGYRVGWVGPRTSLFTITVPTRGAITGQPQEIVDSFSMWRAGPVVLRDADGPLYLWRDYASRKRDFFLTRNGLPILVRSDTSASPEGPANFGAAAGEDAFLLTWMTWHEGSAQPVCVTAQRFSFSGLPLDPEPQVLGCIERMFFVINSYVPRAAWDGERWWVTFSAVSHTGVAHAPLTAWPIGADGTAGKPVELFGVDARARDASFVRTSAGVSVLYARPDREEAFVSRAFLRPIVTKTRGRAVRH